MLIYIRSKVRIVLDIIEGYNQTVRSSSLLRHSLIPLVFSLYHNFSYVSFSVIFFFYQITLYICLRFLLCVYIYIFFHLFFIHYKDFQLPPHSLQHHTPSSFSLSCPFLHHLLFPHQPSFSSSPFTRRVRSGERSYNSVVGALCG